MYRRRERKEKSKETKGKDTNFRVCLPKLEANLFKLKWSLRNRLLNA